MSGGPTVAASAAVGGRASSTELVSDDSCGPLAMASILEQGWLTIQDGSPEPSGRVGRPVLQRGVHDGGRTPPPGLSPSDSPLAMTKPPRTRLCASST